MANTFRHGKRQTEYDAATHAINPNGRVIELGKRSAKKLLREGYVVEGFPPRFVLPDALAPPTQVRSPLSGRYVNVGGRTYRRLLGNGYVLRGRELVPDVVKTRYAPDWAQQFLDGHAEVERRLQDAIRAQEAAGRFVTIHVAVPGREPVVLQRGLPHDRLYHILAAAYELTGDDQGYRLLRGGAGPHAELELARLGVTLELHAAVRGEIVAGTDMNGLCFLEGMVRQGLPRAQVARVICPAPQGNEEEDFGWVGPEDLRRVSAALGVTIEVLLYQTGATLATYAPGRPSDKTVRFYYGANHFSDEPARLHGQAIEWADNLPKVVEDLEAACTPFTALATPVNNDIRLLSVRTADKEYKAPFEGNDEYPTAYSTTGARYMQLRGKLGRCSTPEPGASTHLVSHGITYNDRVAAQAAEGDVFYEYDQRRAYASYNLVEGYTGFPSSFLSLFEYDPAALQSHEGFVYLNAGQVWPHSVFEKQRGWFAFPVVRAALEWATPFEPLVMLVGARAADPFDGEAREVPKHSYNAMIGRCWQHKVKEQALTRDPAEVAALVDDGYKVVAANSIGGSTYTLLESAPEDKEPDLPHVAGYIHALQKLGVYRDIVRPLVAAGREGDILRIWVDGVVLKRKLGFPLDPQVWKPEEWVLRAPRFDCDSPMDYEGPQIDLQSAPASWADHQLLTAERLLITGEAGTGKTYTVNRLYAADPRTVLTAPTHAAASNLEGTTLQKLLATVEKDQGYANSLVGKRVVVDEYTMVGLDMLDKLLELGVRVVLVGDEMQLRNFKGAVITDEALAERGFAVHRMERNYRNVGPMLDLCRAIRGMPAGEQRAMVAAWPGVRTIARANVLYPPAGVRHHIIASRNDLVRAYNAAYSRSLLEAGGNRLLAQEETADGHPLVEGMLVMANSTSKCAGFRNQSMGSVVAEVEYRKKAYVQVRRFAFPEGEDPCVLMRPGQLGVGFAITYHRCQGATYDFPTTLDLDKLHQAEMIYTAVSRVTRLELLTVVTN